MKNLKHLTDVYLNNLLMSTKFQELSKAAQLFYIIILSYRKTYEHQSDLYDALDFYVPYDIYKLDVSNLIVIPSKIFEEYGYSMQYTSKIKRELIDKGFIEVQYGEMSRYNKYNQSTTIYKICTDWMNRKLSSLYND